MSRNSFPSRARALTALACVAALAVLPAAAHDAPDTSHLLAQQLERALERRQVAGAATPEADSLYARAIRAVRTQVPRELLRQGAGMQRLLRERLAADLGPLANSDPRVWDQLLPERGQLAVAAVQRRAAEEPFAPSRGDPSQRLLDRVVADSPAFTRGAGGLILELRQLTRGFTVHTEVQGARPTAYAASRRQEGNPEYVRLQTQLAVALTDLQIAEAASNTDHGLLALYSTLHAQGEVNRLRKQLATTPPFSYAPEYSSYAVEDTRAVAVATVSAELVVSDPATGWRVAAPVEGKCERTAAGTRGALPGDRNGYRNVDAASQLPPEQELLEAAFEDLREHAAALVAAGAADAALHRALRANRRGRGGEALGWLLIARDLGAEPPPQAMLESALARARVTPMGRLGTLEPPPFEPARPCATSPARSPRRAQWASRRSRTPSGARSTAR